MIFRYRWLIIKNILWLAVLPVFSQNNIQSVVRDAKTGEPIPGVTIIIKGTTTGTVSDSEGNFSITAAKGQILRFTFIGYRAFETVIGEGPIPAIMLEEQVEELEEVVVRGYGTQKQRDVTGAISRIDNSSYSLQTIASLDQGMQGLASGMQVSQGSGTPGSSSRVVIRGTGSINSGTEPLYIIDGIPVYQNVNGNTFEQTGGAAIGQNPLADINPNDIQSIDILKDASATAIYGSRGANGVIIITTKNGSKEKTKASFSYKKGMTTPVRTLQFANNREWLEMADQSMSNISYPATFDPNEHTFNSNLTTQPAEWSRLRAMYTNVDYLDEYLNNGSLQEINASVSGGTEKMSSYLSFNMYDEKGISKGNVFKKYGLRTNIDYEPVRWLRTGTRFTASYVDNKRPITGNSVTSNTGGKNDKGTIGGFWSANYSALPFYPVYDDDGNYFDPRSGHNIVASTDRANIRDDVMQYRMIGLTYIELLPVKHLKLRGEAAIDYVHTDQLFWLSGMLRTANDVSSPLAFENQELNRTPNYVCYANYGQTLGIHDFSATAGIEMNEVLRRRHYSKAENLSVDVKETGEFQNGDNTGDMDNIISLLGGVLDNERRFSNFIRGNYKLNNRYLIEGSLRRDGSSKFDASNRWATFVAGSAGWIITEEKFMKPIRPVSFLKARFTIGAAGNDKIQSNRFESTYATWPTYEGAQGMLLDHLGNPFLTWEKSIQKDAGIEAGILKNRITIAFSYYNKKTTDMLLDTPIPLSTGVAIDDESTLNVGDMRNSGIEIDATTINTDHINGLKWVTRINLTTNHTTILALTDAIDENPLGITNGITVTRTGGRLAAFYLAEYAGIDDQGYETIYEIDQEKAKDGIFEKTGNKIRATQSNIDKNKIVHEKKTGLPTYFGGITNTFNYKNIDFSVQVYFQGGNYIYDEAEEKLSYIDIGNHNLLKSVYNNTWTPENTDAKLPQLRWNDQQTPATDNGGGALGSQTTRFLHRADFIRMRNITAGYRLPQKWIQKPGISNIRLYISVQNVFTITRYKGYDPEFVNLGDETSRNLSQGYLTQYRIPLVRTFLIGLDINF